MFEAKLEFRDRADILRLRGELAIGAMKDLKSLMLNLEGRGAARPLIVDLSALKFMDSFGASVIVGLNFKFKGKTIILAGPTKEVKNILIRLFIWDQFRVCGSVKEALRALDAANKEIAK